MLRNTRSKTVFSLFLIGLSIFLLISLYDLKDIYAYYASKPCTANCTISYDYIVNYLSAEKGAKRVERQVDYVLGSQAFILDLGGKGFCENAAMDMFNMFLNLNTDKCSNSFQGYRLSSNPPSPSFYSCSYEKSAMNTKCRVMASGVLLLSRRGLIPASLEVVALNDKTRNGVIVGLKLRKTSCSYNCFFLYTPFYMLILLLKVLASIGISATIYLSKRLWGR